MSEKVLPDEQKMQRYDHVFQRASGSRELVEAEAGEWVRWDDVEPVIEALQELLSAADDTLRSHPETACCSVTREKCAKARVALGWVPPKSSERCTCHDFDGFINCPVHI